MDPNLPLVARERGMVLWITGLSGAGKTTIASHTCEKLRARMANTVFVDGDQFRAITDQDLGHDPESRLKNAFRIARFCKYLSDQGIHVVCATMSLFHECHAWNRANVERYFEVYVRVPIDVLISRNARGLYGRALRGDAANVAGIDLEFEAPLAPDLTIDNENHRSDFGDLATLILSRAGLITDHETTL